MKKNKKKNRVRLINLIKMKFSMINKLDNL